MNGFDIDKLYNKLLPRLEMLEQDRIKLADRLTMLKKVGIGVGIVLAVVTTYFAGLLFGLLAGGALGVTLYTIQYHKMIRVYRNSYKVNVFDQLIGELGPNYQYTQDGQIEEEQIRKSGIFHEFTKAECEDLIEGNFEDYSFKIAETNLWYTKKNSSNTDRGGAVSYIFKGLYFIGSIQFAFPTPIWILSKDHPSVHPVSRVKEGWQKVRIDQSAFRLEYDVYAGDKEAAAKILSSNILDTIMETKAKTVDKNMRLELSFQQKNIYISISTMKELFEPPVKTPITDKENFKDNFKFLVNITGLLQQLTLVNN